MIKIKIKSLWGSILFEYENENNNIKDTLLEAIKSSANLRGADLRSADLRGANLSSADLRSADLSSANLIGADLRGADLSSANLRSANLRGADLRSANLSGADLRGADLSSANLRGADLRGADLSSANLSSANLSGADLSSADLRSANLSGADLRGANLRGADLRGADLSSANLIGADLRGADLREIKKDLFDVLLRAIPEIQNLKKAISDGKIDGSVYEGECSCLCGTLMKSRDITIANNINKIKDSSRPIEMFFMNVKPGDTPETNQVLQIVYDWINEFEGYINYNLLVS